MRKILFTLSIFIYSVVLSQTTFPVNGVNDKRVSIKTFINATIYVDYKTKLTNAVLIIENDRIVEVGTGISYPKTSEIIDLKGAIIYPSFIELYSNYGVNEKKENYQGKRPIDISTKKGAYHWNEAIRSEINAVDLFSISENEADEYRKSGFGTVLTHVNNGIVRGTGTCVLLSNERENNIILKQKATSHFSFDKGTSIQEYPSSLMGTIALIRQTFLDSEWYINQQIEKNISLEAFNANKQYVSFFEAKDKLDIFRIDKIGREFGVNFIIKSNGTEYQNIEDLKKINPTLIIPLNFPKPFDISTPQLENNIALHQLKHWELAPKNLSLLSENDIKFAITSDNLKAKSEFLGNLKKAVKNGLSKENALKALTFTPANILNIESEIGSLAKGKKANFIICDEDIFESGILLENWVNGNKYSYNTILNTDFRGNWTFDLNNQIFELYVNGQSNKPIFNFINKKDTTKVDFKIENNIVWLKFKIDSIDVLMQSLYYNNQLIRAKTYLGNQSTSIIDIKKENSIFTNKSPKLDSLDNTTGEVLYPFLAFGRIKNPEQEQIIFKNATVWTNENEGILTQTDVHINKGKIVAIGKNISIPNVTQIDASNLHITSGIIDEHSHIAISRGVNEGAQASTAEVRIGDVVNSEDINIFRQLAGGVTTAQLLHGSANPIGGQSAIIKLKWGESPEKMKFPNADEFIKFALGENVKQTNWGENYTFRFPQTRMGVEQVYYDMFYRAKEYEKEWKAFNSLSPKKQKSSVQPRRDLDLEALVEILNSKRFITCHSYQQGEINMLMHVADSMGFKINTFTHILEGYKVADKMKKHGVGGSTFSDWWAYKYEVNDAIPYNGALLNQNGIITAFNSDDAEMGRRLNQEAAKAVKYGNVSEEDAWKFVTLNPAKLLHIDNKVGSIKIGKDADLVLWTDNPLSIYAKVYQTYIDGIKFFDINKLEESIYYINTEKNRLISKMQNAINNGEKPEPIKEQKTILYHCDTIEEY